MPEFEIFIERPVKVTVQANSYEEAVEMIKRQYNLNGSEPVNFYMAIDNVEETQDTDKSEES